MNGQMQNSNVQQFYRLQLDDYSTASFVSGSKHYYGTLEDIKVLIEALKVDDKPGNFKELIMAYDAFCAGDAEVSHTVAYNITKLLEPVELISSSQIKLSDYEWEHVNLWDCIYYMRCKEADVQIKSFCIGNTTTRCYKVSFRGLQYGITREDYRDVRVSFWGFPHMLEYDHGAVYNRLYLPDASDADEIDFKFFCEEIFGDG